MERLNSEKLYVTFDSSITPTEPILGRKYTLTHSDTTAELFLNIGLNFAYDKITIMRDEVLAEWMIFNNDIILYAYVYVGERYNQATMAIRDTIFRRELPLALEAIRYGDDEFFLTHPELDKAPIWIKFISSDPMYNKIENWGTPQDYK